MPGNHRDRLDTTGRIAVVPTVGRGDTQRITGVEDTIAITVEIFRPGSAAVHPAEGVVVNIGPGRQTISIQIIDESILVPVAVKRHLNPWDPRLPLFAGGEARIIFGPGNGIVDDAADAAVFIRSVCFLAKVDDVGLAEEQMHRLSQYLAGLGPGEVVAGVRIDCQLRLWSELAIRGPVGTGRNRTALVDDSRHAGRLQAGKIDFDHQPFKERKDFGEFIAAENISRLRLINGTVTETDNNILFSQTVFARIKETVLVEIFKHGPLERTEPAKREDITKADSAAIGDSHSIKPEQGIEVSVPGYELIGSGRNVVNFKITIIVTRDDNQTLTGGRIIQTSPTTINRCTGRKGLQVWWSGEMVVTQGAVDHPGSAAAGCPGKVGRIHEAEEGMIKTGAEAFNKQFRLVRLDPGVDRWRPLYRRCLNPLNRVSRTVKRRWNHPDPVFSRRQVLDQSFTIRIGPDYAGTGDVNLGISGCIKVEGSVSILQVGRTEHVAESILHHLPGRIIDNYRKANQSLLIREVWSIVD